MHKHGLSSDSCKGAPHTLTGCWCRNERTGYTRSHGPVVEGPLKRTEKRSWRCTPAQGRYRKYKREEEGKNTIESGPRQVDEKLPEHYERTIGNTHEDQSRHTATRYKTRTAQGRCRKYKREEERGNTIESGTRQVDEKLTEHDERSISNTHEGQPRHTATNYKTRTAHTQSGQEPQNTQSIVGHQPPKSPSRARGDTLPVRNQNIRTPLGQKRALFSKKSTFLHGPQTTDTSTPTRYTETGTESMAEK